MFENGGPAYYIIFFALLLVDVLMYGFQSAVHSVDEKELERKAFEEKDPLAIHIERYEDNPTKVNQLTSLVINKFDF